MADPLLALQVQPSNIDVAGSLARGQEMQTARLGNLLSQYKLSQAPADEERKNALAAVELRGKDLDQQKTQGEIEKAKIENASAKAGRAAALFGSVVDAPDAAKPLVFQRNRAQAEQEGFDVSKIPSTYSSDLLPQLQSWRASALTAKEQIDTHLAQQKADDDKANKGRDDQYRAQNDAANRDVTIRGQNLADARAKATVAETNAKSWQVLTDPKSNTQYRYNPATGQSTTLDGSSAYTPGGASKINSGQPRSAAALAAQRYVEENPNATAQDVAQYAADYGKTVKSVGAFSTGKQGDLLRSFNVAISHLNTLDGLVDALGNGNVQLLNKASNAYKQQTGSAAPTNFDAAKAIVGDEIIKAIVGGGGALADRENAQNQISRASSPAQLRGVINTYKDLMSGQLRGLKKQYTDTTGRNDFDTRLAPETAKELEGAPASSSKYKIEEVQ